MTNTVSPNPTEKAPAPASVEVPNKTQIEMKRLKSYFPFRHVFAVLEKDEWFVYARPTKHTMNSKLRAGLPVFMQERA